MKLQLLISTALAGLLAGYFPVTANAIITSQGQSWNFVPDAWTRGNNLDTSYFGWDVFERDGLPTYGAFPFTLTALDDSVPDLGGATTAIGTRIYQGNGVTGSWAPTTNGHISSSGNFYSAGDTMNDTITATAPASGVGGYTTVVLQVQGGFGGGDAGGFTFNIDNANPWTLNKQLYSTNDFGLGLYWVEWSAPGNDLPFSINMGSPDPHRFLDAFQVDTFWTPGGAPAINSITAVPEPSSFLLMTLGLCGFIAKARRHVR